MKIEEELEKIVNRALELEKKGQKVTLSEAMPEERDELPLNSPNFGDLNVTLEVVLGQKKMTLNELSKLNVGHILSLEETHDDKIALFVNHKKVGSGEIIAFEGHFGIKITTLE